MRPLILGAPAPPSQCCRVDRGMPVERLAAGRHAASRRSVSSAAPQLLRRGAVVSSSPRSRCSQRRLVAAASAAGGFADPRDFPQQQQAADADVGGGNVGFGGALMNVLNILSGVGLLSVPYALRKAGWAGLAVLWLLGIVTNYTGKVLVESCQEVAARRAAAGQGGEVSYEEAGEAAFGPVGRKLVSATMYTELLGICALLFILEGENMFKLLGTALAPTADAYILIAAALMIPTVWLPDLKALSFLGVFGFAATLTVVATVAFTFATGSFVPGAATSAAAWGQVPVVFGILAFVYAGHGVFPSIQASMRRPQQFPRVLDTAYVIVAGMCTLLGVLGYRMYGPAVRDVVTFNLPPGVPSTLCAAIILVNPIAKLALTMEPVAAAATAALAGRTRGLSEGVRRVAVRTGMALACLGAACCVPFLALVMSLIGSLLTIGTAIILPVAIHLRVFAGRLSAAQVAWDLLVLLIGVGCAASGTASSVLAILQQSSA